LSCSACILTCCYVLGWVYNVEQVMRRLTSFVAGWLGSSNLELAVHRYGIAIDNLSVKTLGEFQRECGFATGSRTEHDNQQCLRSTYH
jgi:hypothetical protein